MVSHDRGAIQAICDRAILLEDGTVIKDGDPEAVMDFYNALIADKENNKIEQNTKENGKIETSSGTGEATVQEINLYNSEGKVVDHIGVGNKIELRIKVRANKDIDSLVLGYSIKDRLGQIMYGTNTWHTKQIIKQAKAGSIYYFTITFFANLGPGSYSIQTALHDNVDHMSQNYEWRDLALVFNIINKDKTLFAGSSWIEPVIKIVNKI